jgi:methionyl-tRNA formyltransferase
MTASPMRLVFAGTPDFAAAVLARLLADGREVVGVYTQPDRPAGRGRRLRASPVKEAALAHGLPIEQPRTLRTEEAAAELSARRPDVLVVAAYGLILPPAVLAIPPLGCLNVHASLLPRWRGAAPIQRAIMAGDEETGVTIMRMDRGLDTGPMLALRRCPIAPDDTAGTLHDRLVALGSDAMAETLDALASGPLEGTPQPAEGVTYAKRIEKEEAWLDWTRGARELERRVRALNPSPIAVTRRGEQRLRIWRAAALARSGAAAPGTVLAAARGGIDVACGEGALRLLELQRPGGRALPAASFLSGPGAIRPGDRLER